MGWQVEALEALRVAAAAVAGASAEWVVVALLIVVVSLFAERQSFGQNAASKRGVVLEFSEHDCTERAFDRHACACPAQMCFQDRVSCTERHRPSGGGETCRPRQSMLSAQAFVGRTPEYVPIFPMLLLESRRLSNCK